MRLEPSSVEGLYRVTEIDMLFANLPAGASGMRLAIVAMILGMAALVVGVGAETWKQHVGPPTMQSIHYSPQTVSEFSARRRHSPN